MPVPMYTYILYPLIVFDFSIGEYALYYSILRILFVKKYTSSPHQVIYVLKLFLKRPLTFRYHNRVIWSNITLYTHIIYIYKLYTYTRTSSSPHRTLPTSYLPNIYNSVTAWIYVAFCVVCNNICYTYVFIASFYWRI